MKTKQPLPYFEDIVKTYADNFYNTSFPEIIENKLLVYSISVFHIIGVIFISIGIFLPPSYTPLYFVYLISIYLSYYIFNGYCFLTILSNKYSGKMNSQLNIRPGLAMGTLFVNALLAIIFYFFPNISFYTLFKHLYN